MSEFITQGLWDISRYFAGDVTEISDTSIPTG